MILPITINVCKCNGALVLVKTINLKITDTAYCVRKLYIIIESGGYILVGIPSMILDISIIKQRIKL